MATTSFIRVPPDSTGKRVDSCQIDVDGNLVERQRMQLAGDASDSVARVTTSDGLSISSAITAPTIVHASDPSVAAGGSTDLDSNQISSGLTGKLLQIIVSSSVPFKAEIKTVLDAVPSSTLITGISRTGFLDITLVSKRFVTVAQSASVGLDGFRVTVTNLDTSEAAAVYATFLYDED